MRLQVALVGIDMAVLLDQAHPDVRAAIATSRSILAELGAKPFLERLDALTAAAGTPGRTEAVPVTESEVAAG
jgi:hypothetical protein